ncbi:MOSC and FAD-binding oxidoreductase domain-containing protein [Amycolatopsis bartoniae]|uniref:Sulfurase n=2 Tax=Amycolatopsis bartoniae TaxID=941986 RepID=A0A8H9J5A7_9PSEU|nr:MOSC and FAD-binding oxidoreductase domain-containing protein [Amycolatopsis bartoniae]TVT05274.1 MOSC domain-containing protein [Amycolatopsis bartoniae]GHF76743.1 sulfurase [Amycolatopsis bartoniae]
MARLLSLNVGMPQDVPWQGRTVHTGIFKQPVDGPRFVRRLNIDGDGQGDLGGHGGEIRAVLVYQRESYDFWRHHLGRDDLEYGRFGENFTVDGLPDDEVHIGDRYRIGEAEFEVTQPRVTCFRLGMRLGEPRMPALLVAHRRPGFYFRVITEGAVQAGDEIVRTRVGQHRMTVAAIDTLLYLPGREVSELRKAVDIPALSPGWRTSFRELLGAGVSRSPGWTGFRPLRVSRIVPESATETSFHFSLEDAPVPLPGQYLTLRIPGNPPLVRNYSLSGVPSGNEYRISVKREGVVSTYLHTRLRVGDSVEVAAPRGSFVLGEDTVPVVLLSAGVGVTPVLAMLHSLAAAGSSREVWWFHSTRSGSFTAEAHELLAGLAHGHEQVFHTGGGSGRIDRAALAGLPSDAVAYVCGPSAFMDVMRSALVDVGLDEGHIHTELFGSLSAINPGVVRGGSRPPHQPPEPAGTGPRVTFARSGISAPWSERYSSVLEFAEACDVPARWSCRTGVCHTCQTPVLSGDVRNRLEPLESPDPGTALICCAQPETDLVLDL